MGNTQKFFPTRKWQFLERSDNYDIMKDKDGLLAEKHIMPNNPKISQQQEMETYYYRYKVNQPIVHVYDAEYTEPSSICAHEQNIIVYTEYIPLRLAATRNLNHVQGLYVLSEALAGFHELYQQFGPFYVTNEHIGFNFDGQVRVWHNVNFGNNHLQRDNIVLVSTMNQNNFDEKMKKRQEEQMVQDIFMAVDDHTHFHYEFKEKMDSFREMDFIKARTMLREHVDHPQMYVPERLNFDKPLSQKIINSQNRSQNESLRKSREYRY